MINRGVFLSSQWTNHQKLVGATVASLLDDNDQLLQFRAAEPHRMIPITPWTCCAPRRLC